MVTPLDGESDEWRTSQGEKPASGRRAPSGATSSVAWRESESASAKGVGLRAAGGARAPEVAAVNGTRPADNTTNARASQGGRQLKAKLLF